MQKAHVAVTALALLLCGCAGVQYKPVALDTSFWQKRDTPIAVAAEKTPEATAYMLGGQGLMDVAINRGNAAKLMERLKQINVERAAAIANNLADGLARRGFKVERMQTIDASAFPEFKAADNPEQFAPRDFRSLKSKGVDRLLLVSVEQIGTTRNYHGFIPLNAPRAVFTVKGQLVDLSNNRLLWYNRHEAVAAIAEPWDQEPDFPNVSQAVAKNLFDGAAQFERSFFGGPEVTQAAFSAPAPAIAVPAAAAAAAPSAAAAGATRTPLPKTIVVVPPAAGTLGAALSGTWIGKWDDTVDHTLVVETIEGRNAMFIYSWGAAAPGERGPQKPGYQRIAGTINDDGSLRGTLGNGALVVYRLSGDQLVGEWQNRGRYNRATLQRR